MFRGIAASPWVGTAHFRELFSSDQFFKLLRNSLMLRTTFAALSEQLVVLTHDLEMLDDFERVLVLDDGRVVADDEHAPALAYYRGLMSR